MCNCSSTPKIVQTFSHVAYQPNPNCANTAQQVIAIQNRLLCIKHKINIKDYNKYLGIVNSLINLQDYCRYDLQTITDILAIHGC